MNEPVASLLEQVLAEQQKQTQLLQQIASNQVTLIEALGEDPGQDDDAPPAHYLDGRPCR